MRPVYLCAKLRQTAGSITPKVKQEGTFLLVGECETTMFYEVREENGKFNLYFNKKKGFKFKKSFSDRDWIETFVERYLWHCCLPCKERGWVYKTRGSGGLCGGGGKGRPPAGSIVRCPECRTEHIVSYNGWRIRLTLNS